MPYLFLNEFSVLTESISRADKCLLWVSRRTIVVNVTQTFPGLPELRTANCIPVVMSPGWSESRSQKEEEGGGRREAVGRDSKKLLRHIWVWVKRLWARPTSIPGPRTHKKCEERGSNSIMMDSDPNCRWAALNYFWFFLRSAFESKKKH